MGVYLVKIKPISKIIFRRPISFEGGKDHIAPSYRFPPYNTIMGVIAYRAIQRAGIQQNSSVRGSREILKDLSIKIIAYGYYQGEKILVPTPQTAGMKRIKLGNEHFLVPKEAKKERKELSFVGVDDIIDPYNIKDSSKSLPFSVEQRPGVRLTNEKRAGEGWLYVSEYLIFSTKKESDKGSGIWVLLELNERPESFSISEGEIVYIGGKGGVSVIESVEEQSGREISCDNNYYWALSVTYSVFKDEEKYYDAPKNALIKASAGVEVLSSVLIDRSFRIHPQERSIVVNPGSCYFMAKDNLKYLYFDQDIARKQSYKIIDFFGKPLLYFPSDACPRNVFLLLKDVGGETFDE